MIYGRIYGFFLNPLKQVTKCCKMFTILADSFPSVLDDHEMGTLHEELRRYDVWDPPAHRRTGEHPFGGSNRVLPEWRTQLVCHAAPPGRKNNNELTQCLFLTVVDEPMNVTPPEMYLR